MKKGISLFLVLTLVVSLFAGCAGGGASSAAPGSSPAASPAGEAAATAPAGKKPIVALLMGKSTSPYSGSYFKAYKDNVNLYPDIEWIAFDAQSDATLQAQQADEAIAMGASVIMMQPIDSNALVASAEKIKAAGIPLVNCNTRLTEAADEFITTYYGPDNYTQGQLAADLMHQKFPDGCNYVHLGMDPSNETGRLRLGGFTDRNEEKGYKLNSLGVSPSTEWQVEKGKSYMSAFLSKFPGEIDAVWAIDDAVGYGALQAVQEDVSGLNGEIQIVSVGGQEANLDAIKEGKNYLGTIYQSSSREALGAMKLVVDILDGKMPESKNIVMDMPIITKENVDEFEPAY